MKTVPVATPIDHAPLVDDKVEAPQPELPPVDPEAAAEYRAGSSKLFHSNRMDPAQEQTYRLFLTSRLPLDSDEPGAKSLRPIDHQDLLELVRWIDVSIEKGAWTGVSQQTSPNLALIIMGLMLEKGVRGKAIRTMFFQERRALGLKPGESQHKDLVPNVGQRLLATIMPVLDERLEEIEKHTIVQILSEITTLSGIRDLARQMPLDVKILSEAVDPDSPAGDQVIVRLQFLQTRFRLIYTVRFAMDVPIRGEFARAEAPPFRSGLDGEPVVLDPANKKVEAANMPKVVVKKEFSDAQFRFSHAMASMMLEEILPKAMDMTPVQAARLWTLYGALIDYHTTPIDEGLASPIEIPGVVAASEEERLAREEYLRNEFVRYERKCYIMYGAMLMQYLSFFSAETCATGVKTLDLVFNYATLALRTPQFCLRDQHHIPEQQAMVTLLNRNVDVGALPGAPDAKGKPTTVTLTVAHRLKAAIGMVSLLNGTALKRICIEGKLDASVETALTSVVLLQDVNAAVLSANGDKVMRLGIVPPPAPVPTPAAAPSTRKKRKMREAKPAAAKPAPRPSHWATSEGQAFVRQQIEAAMPYIMDTTGRYTNTMPLYHAEQAVVEDVNDTAPSAESSSSPA